MHRVHNTIPQAGELVLMDSTSNLDRNDIKLFHLICPSFVGGLPLASLLTTREDKGTIMFGINLLEEVLPPGAFYGRDINVGPKLFMTDDSDALRNALSGKCLEDLYSDLVCLKYP